MQQSEGISQPIILINQIVEVYYPELFRQLNNISNVILENSNDIDLTVQSAILERINKELDSLYRKNKLLLFPFIEKKISQGGKLASPSPTAFSWVISGHQEVLQTTRHFKESIGRLMMEENSKSIKEMSDYLQQFESSFIFLKLTMEEKVLPLTEDSPFN